MGRAWEEVNVERGRGGKDITTALMFETLGENGTSCWAAVGVSVRSQMLL